MAVIQARLDLEPADAVRYFASKGEALAWDHTDVWREVNARSFTVAKAMTLDIQRTIQTEVARAIGPGQTFEEFKRRLRPRLQDLGWWGTRDVPDPDGNLVRVQLGSHRRLRTIYQTNVQTAYMAGRYKRYLDNVADRPYWRYVAIMDSRTRPAHAELHGKVFRWDDPIWEIIWPPNGWGCRCRVTALTEAEFRALGVPLENGRDHIVEREAIINKAGDTATVKGFRYRDENGREHTFWPDPGWDYNPGAAGAWGVALAQALDKKQAAARAVAAAAVHGARVVADAPAAAILGVRRLAKLDGDSRKWVVAQGKATGFEHLVAYDAISGKELGRTSGQVRDRVPLPPDVVAAMADRARAVVLHHNHPDSLSLSLADLSHLTNPGVHAVVAHGHDRSLFRAGRGADFGIWGRVLEAAHVEFIRQIELARLKHLDTVQMEAHIFNLALAEAGLIIYQSTVSKAVRARWELNAAAYQAMVQAIADAIMRAR